MRQAVLWQFIGFFKKSDFTLDNQADYVKIKHIIRLANNMEDEKYAEVSASERKRHRLKAFLVRIAAEVPIGVGSLKE